MVLFIYCISYVGFTDKLNKINTYFSSIRDLASKDILTKNDKLILFNDKFNNVLQQRSEGQSTNFIYPCELNRQLTITDQNNQFYTILLTITIY